MSTDAITYRPMWTDFFERYNPRTFASSAMSSAIEIEKSANAGKRTKTLANTRRR
jgi:hypothetical protein